MTATLYTSYSVPSSSPYTTTTTASTNMSGSAWYGIDAADSAFVPNDVLQAYGKCVIQMKDGSTIYVDENGNFRIEDKDAKVTYSANRNRAFNPYVNAGDLLADFINYLRREVPRIGSKDVAELPLNLFVQWLVMEAAENDGDPIPDDVVPVPKDRLLVSRLAPRCSLPTCRRFISKAAAQAGFLYCNPDHAAKHGQLLKAA